MELEVGMYVRTELYSISKIIYIEDTNWLEIDKNKGCLIHDETVLKASHNIIDLIEVGDYVNGYPVYEIIEYENNTRAIVIGDDNKSIIWEESSQYIKTVLTKEQYESMAYKVGE